MRAYNRTDDHSFRSTTRVLAKDAYDNAGHKRKKLVAGAVGAVGVVGHGVEAGRSKVSSGIQGGREKVEHIKDKIVEHTPLAGKLKHRKSSDSGHHLSGKMKLGAAFAAGAAAAHLKSRHEKQESRDQHEGHAVYGGEAVSHTRRQERRGQREGHAAHGGEVVVHTKKERVAEWRDGVNESMSDASINNRFGKPTGHQSHVATTTGTISDAAFHNQFARPSGHRSHAVNFTGRNRFEDDMLEARMSDHSRTGLVENVDVRELKDDRIHTGEMTVIEDHRHGHGRGGGLIDSHTHIEKTTIHGGHEHGHGRGLHGLAHIGRSSHHPGHDHLTDARIQSGETSFHEERSHSHSGMSNGHIRGGGPSHKKGFNGLADTRIVTEKTTIREAHKHGAGHGSRHSGRNDFLDSRTSHMHTGEPKTHESHGFDRSDSRIHSGESLHSAGHGGFVESRTRSEDVIFREGQNIDGMTDSRFRGDEHLHHEDRGGLSDSRIIEKTTVHEGRADSHDSRRFGESKHGRHSDSDLRGRHGSGFGVVNNAVAVGTAIGATVGGAVKQAVTGHGSHHDYEHHHRSHSQGRERDHSHHGKGGELVLHRQKSVEWQDDKLSDSDLLNGHSRDHYRGKHGPTQSNHHTGVSSDSRANFEFEAERRHGHKSSGGHLGGHTDKRIVKETRVTKFADNLRTNEALPSPGYLRPGPAPFSEAREEVFHDAPSRASGSVHGTLGDRRVKSQENTWVGNVSSAANGGAVKKVTQVEETWDIDDDNSTEVYNFMEEKRKGVAVPGSESKVVTEQKWWNTSRGKAYK